MDGIQYRICAPTTKVPEIVIRAVEGGIEKGKNIADDTGIGEVGNWWITTSNDRLANEIGPTEIESSEADLVGIGYRVYVRRWVLQKGEVPVAKIPSP